MADGNGIIKKQHVTYTVATILATVSALAWLNSTYVTAKDFAELKNQTTLSVAAVQTSVVRVDLNNRRMHLVARNKTLEDKLFELQSIRRENRTSSDEASLERIVREYDTNNIEIQALQQRINALTVTSQ